MSSNSAGVKFEGQFQRFEFVDEKSSKFWEIRVNGTSVDVHYGKIDTTGQGQTKEFEDAAAAQQHAEKLINEKLKKGYVTHGLRGSSTSSDADAAAPKKVKGVSAERLPKEFVELQNLWKEISCCLKNVDDPDEYDRGLIDGYETRFAASCFEFEPVIAALEPSRIDRLGHVLRGPVYTCKGFEWPTESGYPMVPFLQLDLDRCGEIGGIDLGGGLLQAFMGHEKFAPEAALIRLVPRADVSAARLTPAPKFSPEIKAFSDICWATQVYDPDDEDCQALQITGFGKARFTMHTMDPLTESFEIEMLERIGVSVGQRKQFDALLAVMRKKFKPSGFHLFGTFHPIQYNASERPKPLFCFESEQHGFNFGDGNGQIFFLKREGAAPRFTFDWSCF